MKISSSFEQACGILAVLAEHHGRPVTTDELNERLAMSASYLAKITRKLVLAGIIISTQGARGGYVLAKPMEAITLLMVLDAVEGTAPLFVPSGVIERVFLRRQRIAKRGLGLLANRFAAAETAWRRELSTVTMETIVASSLQETADA